MPGPGSSRSAGGPGIWLAALVLALLAPGCSTLLDFGSDPAGATDGAATTPDAGEPIPPDAPPDAPTSCANGTPDEGETSLDCGGPSCAPCPTGETCLAGRDCVGGGCALGRCEDHPRDCASARIGDPTTAGGLVTIDPDGAGTEASPITVFCEQTIADGGWQLVSVVPAGGVAGEGGAPVPFVGPGYCELPTVPCAGQIHPTQVSDRTELLVLDPATGDTLLVSRFSAGPTSALRFISLERTLSTSEVCTAPHICADTTSDPILLAISNGYAMVYGPPLVQWWRTGGWWLGAGAASSTVQGNVLRTSYSGSNQLSTRATAAGTSTAHSVGEQRIFARVPAFPATGPTDGSTP